MVSVTVILAAIISTFVLGMATNIPVTRTLVVTADAPDADRLIIVYKGGPDEASFSYGIVSVTPGITGPPVTWSNTTPHGAPASQQFILGKMVGSQVIATGTTGQFAGKDHVLVTGYFNDGTSQVLLNVFI